VVIDCRPADRIKPRDEDAFAATKRACSLAGWEFRLVTGHDPVWLNLLVVIHATYLPDTERPQARTRTGRCRWGTAAPAPGAGDAL
jgi:hypothetical protein